MCHQSQSLMNMSRNRTHISSIPIQPFRMDNQPFHPEQKKKKKNPINNISLHNFEIRLIRKRGTTTGLGA